MARDFVRSTASPMIAPPARAIRRAPTLPVLYALTPHTLRQTGARRFAQSKWCAVRQAES